MYAVNFILLALDLLYNTFSVWWSKALIILKFICVTHLAYRQQISEPRRHYRAVLIEYFILCVHIYNIKSIFRRTSFRNELATFSFSINLKNSVQYNYSLHVWLSIAVDLHIVTQSNMCSTYYFIIIGIPNIQTRLLFLYLI